MSTHELGPLPEPDGWALGDAYYPAKSTQLGRVRFAGAKAERYTAEQVLAEVARAVEAERATRAELLEALQTLVEVYETSQSPKNRLAAWEDARAAIAKAEGAR